MIEWISLQFSLSMLRERLLLTLLWRRSQSHRNQSINLQRNSADLFLYDRDLYYERIKWWSSSIKWSYLFDFFKYFFFPSFWNWIDSFSPFEIISLPLWPKSHRGFEMGFKILWSFCRWFFQQSEEGKIFLFLLDPQR